MAGTGEYNNTTKGKEFNTCSKNTPISLFIKHEGSVSLIESKRMLNCIILWLMELLWSGVGLSVAAWLTPADTKQKKLPMSECKTFTE